MTGLPARRQAWTTCFCTLGTSSGGISTPRSPRATISASASSMISARRWIADGFSSLTMTPARPATSLRPFGHVVRPLDKRERDPIGAVIEGEGEIGAVLFGDRRQRQHRIRHVDPLAVGQGCRRPGTGSRRIRRRRSRLGAAPCRRRAAARSPAASASKISGCGSGARVSSPGCRSRSRRNWAPADKLDPAFGEGAEAQLWPLQIGEDADRPPGIALSTRRIAWKRAW